MSVIFGWKQVDVTKIGYKKDFCEACKSPEVIEEWRWFTWGCLFGIPLLPLGFIHTWICSKCKRQRTLPVRCQAAPESSMEACHYCGTALMTHPFALCAKCNLLFYP